MRATRLPDARQIALTWSIPASFGGLTTSMLRRSRSFRVRGGVKVMVGTLDPHEDRTARDRMLADRAVLVDGLSVVNLYDWLREHPLPGGSLNLERDLFTPLGGGAGDDGDAAGDDCGWEEERDVDGGPVRRRVRRDADGAVLQIDHLRVDGTLVLSDRRDCAERGVSGGRSIVLCDESGAPVRSWRRIWHLYTAWLDRLTAKQPSVVIVDSKVVAKFLATYRRDHVTTVHVVHGSHLNAGPEPVRASRREVFAHLDDFDAVVFQTDAQRRDVREIVGPAANLVTVPNALPDGIPSNDSARSGAVMVARLEPLKQVEHAIEAVRRANRMLSTPIALDVYGDGPLRDELEEQTAGDPLIRLNGFRADVAERLAGASVLLMTSRSEAFGLAIGEAMAVGCLPIAYDISYGPGDLIRNGKDGWLVPPDDVDALAAALVEAARLPRLRVVRMRKRARTRAADLSEEKVLRLWATMLHDAARRKSSA